MSCLINIGIIPDIETNRDYSCPAPGESFEEHINRYGCISVDDEELSGLVKDTFEAALPASYCCLDNERCIGIDPYGVTLLPPGSVGELTGMLGKYSHMSWYSELSDMCRCAVNENRYMIFFGV